MSRWWTVLAGLSIVGLVALFVQLTVAARDVHQRVSELEQQLAEVQRLREQVAEVQRLQEPSQEASQLELTVQVLQDEVEKVEASVAEGRLSDVERGRVCKSIEDSSSLVGSSFSEQIYIDSSDLAEAMWSLAGCEGDIYAGID